MGGQRKDMRDGAGDKRGVKEGGRRGEDTPGAGSELGLSHTLPCYLAPGHLPGLVFDTWC